MGRGYTDDKLLEAVIKYANAYRGIIKFSDLAAWSSVNIDGMEGVRYYHFSRPRIEKDKKNPKKTIEVKRPCTEKIEEINKTRSVTARGKMSVLLNSSSVNAFFELPKSSQIKSILEAREILDETLKRNVNLSKRNDELLKVNSNNEEVLRKLELSIKNYKKEYQVLNDKINYVIKMLDNEQRKQKLEEIGITEDGIDIRKNRLALKESYEMVEDIKKEIRDYENMKKADSETEDVVSADFADIMKNTLKD